jgi:GNAT superfamily N-acetyltransferase
MIREWSRGDYTISTDPHRLDLRLIHEFLSQRSYWAVGRSRERVARSIEHSIAFGLYHPSGQVGFARVVTDHVVIALLADVFVLEAHRGRGLGIWLVETAVNAPEIGRVRRWMLGTRDAHRLYQRFGFTEPEAGVLMERLDPDSDRE